MARRAIDPILRRHGLGAEFPHRNLILRILRGRAPRGRARAARRLVRVMGLADSESSFVTDLARCGHAVGERICLELIAGGAAWSERSLPDLLKLLRSRKLTGAVRARATRAMLRRFADDAPGAVDLLRALADGWRPSRAVSRLSRLAGYLGDPPALAIVSAEIEARSRVPCPLCSQRLDRPAFPGHVWEKHGLIASGKRILSPRQVVTDAVAEDVGKPGTAIERAWLWAVALDPNRAEEMVYRAMHAVRHPAAPPIPWTVSRCPDCLAPVKLPEPLRPAERSRTRLTADGVTIEYRGGLRRVRRSFVTLLLLAALMNSVATEGLFRWTGTALLVLGAAWVWRGLPSERAAAGELIDHVWQVGLRRAASEPRGDWPRVIARFALAGLGLGSPEARGRLLRRLIRQDMPDECRPALWLLWAADVRRRGGDPLPWLADVLSMTWYGPTPWRASWELAGHDGPHRDEPARFRALLAARGFAHGYTPADFAHWADPFPDWFGDAVWVERAYRIWHERDRRPWRQLGPALTLFDLAEAAELGRPAFSRDPDLLIWVPAPAGEGGGFRLTPHGLSDDEQQFRAMPEFGATRRRWLGGGYEQMIDGRCRTFADDPRYYCQRLSAWCAFWLCDRPPLPDAEPHWPIWREVCPECGVHFRVRPGRVGATDSG